MRQLVVRVGFGMSAPSLRARGQRLRAGHLAGLCPQGCRPMPRFPDLGALPPGYVEWRGARGVVACRPEDRERLAAAGFGPDGGE